MEKMKWTILILITLTTFCFCMGCTQTAETSTASVTDTPTLPIVNTTTAIPTATATPIPVRAITATPTPEPTVEEPIPDWTEAPIIIPIAESDTTKINFTSFVSADFMAKYPATWEVRCETFTLTSTTLYGQDIWKPEGRMVSFVSEDGKTKMLVSVRDFLQPGPNRYKFTPTIDSARKSVALLFPNAASETSVYNYEYKKNEQMLFTSKYDVVFVPTSEYYPYTYTEETWTTYNHMFNVDFVLVNGKTLDDYRDLRYLMMKSVITEGTQSRAWWT
jgi:hypothetical protein